MRAGIVTKWFNRGQPVVGRQLRSALEELGHETLILARPKKERGPQKGALKRDDVWDQPGVTEASAYDIPLEEYLEWVEREGVEVLFCDQNYQFEEIRALRERGVRTIGRFVWEHFAAEHVEGALSAYDVVYSFTRCEQRRYAELGIESPYVPWGIHPELLEVPVERIEDGLVRMIFPGGFIGHRKPLAQVIEAFERTREERLRLLVKAQVERKTLEEVRKAAERDGRIELLLDDQPTGEHLRAVAAADVCIAPSRWEGLGLPLYEAMAFGQPTVTNDKPPMNEVIEHEHNGLLVGSIANGTAKSGIPAYDPSVEDLAEAMERLVDDELRGRLESGAREVREVRDWRHTVDGMSGLIGIAEAQRAASGSA